MRKSLRKSLQTLATAAFLAAVGAAWRPLAQGDEQNAQFRRAETFEDAHAATCRVCVEGARGTGFFIGVVGDRGYVMTNYHVVTRSRDAKLDFWTNGRQESIRGQIDGRYFNVATPADFATVVVDAAELKRIDPPFLALGGADAKPSVGAMIVSSGAPDGRFPQAWKGRILEYFNDKTAVFSPPPVPGQSGSPICEYVDGELFVTGILTWLVGERGNDDSKGGAIPVMNLYRALNNARDRVGIRASDAAAIPPGATECRTENDDSSTNSEDFRNRAPVQEFSDDMRIFEDSDRRWRERGKEKRPRRRDKQPADDAESNTDDAGKDAKIGDRLKDGAIDAFSKTIADKLEERIDSVQRELLKKWNAVKYAIFAATCLALAVAFVVAEALVKIVKFLWRKIKGSVFGSRSRERV